LGVFNKSWNENRSINKGPQKCIGYIRQSLVKGIRSKIYPREGVIHVFQAPSTIQEHREEKNPRDKLLLVGPGNSSSIKFVNN
jgi:hypothetical protein